MDIKLSITADAPLSFSERKPGGVFQQSLPYVPGSALRGALAAHLLGGPWATHKAHHYDPGCAFCRVFLGPEAAIFTHALPARDSEDEVQVLPATAVSCKRTRGFRPGGHGVFDTLIERLCLETLAPAGLVYNPVCPVCQSRVEAFRGFYVRHSHGEHATHYHTRTVDQRLLTRVAINRPRMVAEEGLLFSPYVISEMVEQDRHGSQEEPHYQPTVFVGNIWGLPKDFDAQWFERLKGIGASASRGLGHVRVQAGTLGTADHDGPSVQERATALDEAIATVWGYVQRFAGNDRAKDGFYFTLSLRSDAVLHTPAGLPTMIYDAPMLAAVTGIKATLVRSYASYGYGGGWNSAWGMPKPSQVLARAGSVYVFWTDGLTPADYDALAKLEWQGIGELTPEGYGQVRVSDVFHLKRRGT